MTKNKTIQNVNIFLTIMFENNNLGIFKTLNLAFIYTKPSIILDILQTLT